MKREWFLRFGRWVRPVVITSMFAAASACTDDDSASTDRTPPTPDITTDEAVFEEKGMALTLDGDGALLLSVPIGNRGRTSVAGTFAVTLRDFTGATLGQASKAFTAAPNGSTIELALTGLPAGTTRADLAKFILAYDVTWDSGSAKGTRSAYDALRKLQVHLAVDDEVEVGQPLALTVFTVDPATQKPIANAEVEVVATLANGQEVKATLKTDDAGIASGEAALPEGTDVGAVELAVTVTVAGASVAESVPVTIVRNQKILITSDKPLYQPGQTVHLRALALRSTDKSPEAKTPMIFEIEDARGNLIDRRPVTTDEFGIASTELKLAHELNLGQWTIRAIMGGETGTTSEKTVTVERYVLPKFKVTAKLDSAWYRPGAKVTVSGDVAYFFGKSVAGGKVRVVGSTFDVDFTPFVDLEVTTSNDGAFSAELTVPSYVVGTALDQGKGLLKVDLIATDTAGQVVGVSRTAAIAQGAVDVTLVPESGKLVAGVENTVYVVTSDPVGAPLAASVDITLNGTAVGTITTNERGFGALAFTPAAGTTGALVMDLVAKAGAETVELQRTLNVGAPSETVLLRTDKAVYAVGDTLSVEARVGEARERVWLDLVSDGRTVQQVALDVVDGVATHAVDIDGALEGELRLSVFYVGEKGTLVRDTQVVFVESASELTVAMTPEKESYLPGDTAKVDVVVKNGDGQGVVAAVGLQIVDEAVFALQEVQPGLLKVFFDLAKELATPSVSPACGGCDPTSVVTSDGDGDESYDDKAKIAFASVEVPGHETEIDTYKGDVAEVSVVLKPWMDQERLRLVESLSAEVTSGILTAENLASWLASEAFLGTDPWGRELTGKLDASGQTLTVSSMGPDERGATVDDLALSIPTWEFLYRNQWAEGGGVDGADGPFPGGAGGDWNAGDATDGTDGTEPTDGSGDGGEEGPRVRQYFPETLYVNPALITGGDGKASFSVEVADSITSWRMTGLASSAQGELGSGTGALTVFQPFFADIDFPVAITRNDAFTAPVAVYNYLETAQTVTLALEPADWFEASGPTTQTVTLEPNQVKAVSFGIRALEVGVHGLTVVATAPGGADAVKRTVTVNPDGKEFPVTHSARFAANGDGPATDTVTRTVTIPENNIDGAQRLTVKVYPGFMSQVVEGMDSLLQLPGGCFEQTTSTAWPNVLVTDYLSKTGTLDPATEIKAREYIASGYQQLVAFECASGGFNWWVGDDPGNAILTAISLLMFTDTKNVSFVDDAVITRAAQWLVDRQQSDGSWTEERHLHAGNENLGAGSLRASAYITWSLLHSGEQAGAVQKAIPYLRNAVKSETDLYTISLVVIALGLHDSQDGALQGLVAKLHDARVEDGDKVYWTPDSATMVGGYGDAGNIETTALVTLALMQAGAYPNDVQGALNYLIASKDANGNWGYSTQATVLTLKALIGALSKGSPNADADLTVKLNGAVVGTRSFDALNADVLWQLELAGQVPEGENEVTLEYSGTGNFMWQIAGAHYVPWAEAPEDPNDSPLAITVDYDKTTLAANDTITVTVTVSNESSDPDYTGMMMAEIGLPPGFDFDPTLLDAVVSKGQGAIAKYEFTSMRLVVYLEPVTPEKPVSFQYGLRARYPLEATAPASETYLYYNKAVSAEAAPVALEVQ
ncbi:MAG: hypothetical protein IV100_31585 [Myxococcales bacterium]|nr:hypothetical protein [Myxococcales bacterium]